jgi:hypothetical protein
MSSVFTLQHCCRSGKTLQACVALVGRRAVPEGVDLRNHQIRCLKKMARVEGLQHCADNSGCAPPVVSAMVFSSSAVLRQFHGEYLRDTGVRIVCLCSHPPDDADDADVSTTPERIRDIIRDHRESGDPVVILVLYNSLAKLFQAVEMDSGRVDVICFDEAHNLHTERCSDFWSDPDRLDLMFPVRVFLTATPREEMVSGDFVRVYGNPTDKEHWDVFDYADALQLQRTDPTAIEMVKPLRVKVLINGCTKERLERESIANDPEFFDVVAILREIGESTTPIRRVKVYNKLAKVGVRSSEYLSNNTIWREALVYLHARGEARSLTEGDLLVKNVDGTMACERDGDSDESRLSETLAWFNEPVVEADPRVRILLSCQVFREGVTLKRVDLTVFADGKGSKRDIIQSGLRGARADPSNPGRPLDILLLVNASSLEGSGVEDARAAHDRISSALKSRNGFETIAKALNTLMETDPEIRRELERAVCKAERRVDRKEGGKRRRGRAFAFRVQRELIRDVEFGWDEPLSETEARLLHSAAIKMKLSSKAVEFEDNIEVFNAWLKEYNPEWDPNKKVEKPCGYKDRAGQMRWRRALEAGGWISENLHLLRGYPMVQKAYDDFTARARVGNLHTRFEDFEIELQKAKLAQNQGGKKRNNKFLEPKFYKRWSRAMQQNGFFEKNPDLRRNYPLVNEAFERDLERNDRPLDKPRGHNSDAPSFPRPISKKRTRDALREAERGIAKRSAWVKRYEGLELTSEEEALADAYERENPSARTRARREYGETWVGDDHAEWKTAMNDVFGNAVRDLAQPGLVLVLDDDAEPKGGFGTSRRLADCHGVKPEELRIVQMDKAKANRMRSDPVFGSRVVESDVVSHLKSTREKYKAVYLDLCGTWGRQLRPALEALLDGDSVKLGTEFMLGVTWCTRDASGETADEAELMLFRLLSKNGRRLRKLGESSFKTMRTRFFLVDFS